MLRALALARRGLEHVSPNPMVGAVLVKDGQVIGEGWHRRFGEAHAEVEAIRSAGEARGADLYVTLEPCGHHGKTPPCAEAIIAAGIRRVHYAVPDPNPRTRGVGPRLLRQAGVEVSSGLQAVACSDLNAPFFHWIGAGRPWVILKWAMSLDGRTATARGESRWITGEEARRHAHGLRRRVDAVLVGTETALRDDPLLTPRPPRGRRPARVVLDRRGRLPLRLRILSEEDPSAGGGERIYATVRDLPARRRRILESRGIRILEAPAGREGLDLDTLAGELGALGVSQLLVEGGATLAGSFLRAGLVDEVAAYVAPRLIGGRGAPAPLGAGRAGVADLVDSPWLVSPIVKRLGRDLLIQGRIGPR